MESDSSPRIFIFGSASSSANDRNSTVFAFEAPPESGPASDSERTRSECKSHTFSDIPMLRPLSSSPCVGASETSSPPKSTNRRSTRATRHSAPSSETLSGSNAELSLVYATSPSQTSALALNMASLVPQSAERRSPTPVAPMSSASRCPNLPVPISSSRNVPLPSSVSSSKTSVIPAPSRLSVSAIPPLSTFGSKDNTGVPGQSVPPPISTEPNSFTFSTGSITVSGLFRNLSENVVTIPLASLRTSDSHVSVINGMAEMRLIEELDSNSTTDAVSTVTPPQERIRQQPVYRYPIEQEKLPDSLPCFSPDFRAKLNNGIRVAQNITNLLRSSGIENASLQNISQVAERLSNYDTAVTRTVAVGGDGEAVTHFATEYRYHDRSNYMIKIEYLSGEGLDSEIVQLLDDYRFSHAPDFRRRNDLSADEVIEALRKSEAAEAKFSAAFADCPNWGLVQLRDFNPNGYERALEIVRGWAQSIVWPGDMEGGFLTQTAETSAACSRLLDQFMESSLWPFVKIVRVYLRAAVLRLGLVLTDLPGIPSTFTSARDFHLLMIGNDDANTEIGFHDANSARVLAAKRYLSNCDDIFVVSGIKRAIDNVTISNIIREHVETPPGVGRTKTPNITVICSRAAEFNRQDEGIYRDQLREELARVENRLRLAKNGYNVNLPKYKEARIEYNAIRLHIGFIYSSLTTG
ncbi:hypothetical protein PRK78_003290 [Emydomyces testavorans]|uniref:Uncharacterized protein n=1 Tax=Emydomyces testavorans TaxID=2070801 RepID=A0AAF0II92_9EURO|nr:hypothetical protein PRK78_003290 [Emydomyces testavorans]